MSTDYLKKRQEHIFNDRPLPPKKVYTLKPVSDKRAAKEAKEKRQLKGDDSPKEKWFQARRREQTGTCQCGCGRPSAKNDNINFRSGCCHVFPQRIFKSIRFHPLNCVERNFWDGCHSNMDNRSMDRWPGMADWEDIKERFYILAPLITDQERAKKFYKHLKSLVYNTKV